jgi:crossover junction endodeoxyribonuclease RusA
MSPESKVRLNVFVPGRPAPQGSKHYFGPGRVVEMSKYVAGWRADIREVLVRVWGGQPPMTGAVVMGLEFVLPRPASTPKTRTPLAIKRPDWDKLSRAVCDAITSAGVYKDDSQVIDAWVHKRLAGVDEQTGCRIRLLEILDE